MATSLAAVGPPQRPGFPWRECLSTQVRCTRHVLGQGTESLLALAHGLLGLVAFGDVTDDRVQQGALAQSHGRRVHLDVTNLTVRNPVARNRLTQLDASS